MMLNAEHETVLLQEAVDVLVQNPSGSYIDATFGRGGHSRRVLDLLAPDGRLLAIDKDLTAIESANRLFGADQRFEIAHGSFSDIKTHVSNSKIETLNGVLADLGVSSPQLDDAERGFSFLNDGPLDMRMDITCGQSAAEWLAVAKESEIAKVLREYGEEKFSKRIARAIFESVQLSSVTTTLQLAKIVSEANPSWEKHKHPATRSFQAIRIKINNELSDLEKLLDEASKCLCLGGRLVVISFHSLEDRMVKRFMRDKAKGNTPPPGIPMFEKDIVRNFKTFGRAVKPGVEEVERNVRARSAVMRVLEKISDD